MSDYIKSNEFITVDQITKFGVRVKGNNYNYGKFYDGASLEVGKTYEIELVTSPKGAKYINRAKAIAGEPIPAAQVTAVPSKPVQAVELKAREQATVYGSSLSPADKDTRILVQGVLQAVRQSPTLEIKEGETVDQAVHRTVTTDVEFIRNFGK